MLSQRELVEEFRGPVGVAVEQLLHRTDRASYHERWPPGQCPLCTPAQNALVGSDFLPRVKALMADLDAEI